MMQIYASLIETSKWYQGDVCVCKNCSKYIHQKKNPNLSLYSLLLSFEKIGTPSGYISQNVLNYYSAMNATEEVSSEKIRLLSLF